MAYISKEDVTAIRNELKATFPKFTFGVRKMHGGSNGVDVTIKSGPVDFSDCFTHGEGYGRPLQEATMVGLPVMVSGWSGHLDFLNLGLKFSGFFELQVFSVFFL